MQNISNVISIIVHSNCNRLIFGLHSCNIYVYSFCFQVHVRSPFILNGVCVRWKGYLDMERLDGVGAIEFDEEAAAIEDAALRDTVEAYNRRVKEFEEHSKARSRQIAAFQHAAAAHAAHAAHAAQAAHVAAAQQQQAVAAESASARPASPSQIIPSITSISSSNTSVSSSLPARSGISPTSASTVMASPTNNNSIGSCSMDSTVSMTNSFLTNSHSTSNIGALASHTGSNNLSVGSSDLIGDHKPVVDPPFLGGGGGHNTGLNIHAELIEVSERYLLLANEFDTLIYNVFSICIRINLCR